MSLHCDRQQGRLSIMVGNKINAQTGEAWKIEDVPMLWRDEVQALLEESDENPKG